MQRRGLALLVSFFVAVVVVGGGGVRGLRLSGGEPWVTAAPQVAGTVGMPRVTTRYARSAVWME